MRFNAININVIKYSNYLGIVVKLFNYIQKCNVLEYLMRIMRIIISRADKILYN